MKHIRNLNDLSEYGVTPLTGEACGYGYRILCDLTAHGVQLLQNALEIVDIKLRDNWNSGAIASVMLPPQMFTPLAIFALFDAGCTKVFTMYSGEVFGVESTDEPDAVEDFIKWHQGEHCDECGRYGKAHFGSAIQYQYRNAGYSRHRHVMTGRTS